MTMRSDIDTDIQRRLTLGSDHDTASGKGTRRGPPNRMNDLVYRDWMKFQKSFFRYSSDQTLVEECIYFFTKAVWDNGQPSRVLVVGCDAFSLSAIPAPRVVRHVGKPESFDAVGDAIAIGDSDREAYDFVMLDLRGLITRQDQLDKLIEVHSDHIFGRLRAGLRPDRYCCVIVGLPESGGGGFPFPWAVGLSARSHLRLKDERVGLIEDEDRVFYCLFMQAASDRRPPRALTSKTLLISPHPRVGETPAWIIPKPPPRKPHEVLHPAKFPETLIEELVKVHSATLDNIFDPMVGTGSTVLAALRTNRHGYGIDLSGEFIRIASARIRQESEPSLFDGPALDAHVFVGDATRLDEIRGLEGIQFQYVVTSPPYWSMLRNPGSENQKARRRRDLPLVYSDDPRDLGNITDYDQFIDILADVYCAVAERLSDNGMLTVVIKNVKRKHILHTLAWDLACRLSGPNGRFEYVGTTLWCQDDVSIKPFAVGIHWVSNILHTYCVHFRKRQRSS